MNINQVVESLQTGLMRAGHVLLMPADADFASTLTMGQVIKGKVLRHFEGSKYEVDFYGHNKVVDSSVPLKTGEILHGRVIGIDEKIQLKRVFSEQADNTFVQQNTKIASQFPFSGRSAEDIVNGYLDKYLARLNPEHIAAIMKMAKMTAKPELTAMSALVLSKSGLPIDSALIRAVLNAITSRSTQPETHRLPDVPKLAGDISAMGSLNTDAAGQLATVLKSQQMNDNRSVDLDSRKKNNDQLPQYGASPIDDTGYDKDLPMNRDSRERIEWMLGRLLLNVQTDRSVNHKLMSFPIWFDDSLIEVDVSFFSQNKKSITGEGIRHQKLLFSLSTDSMGDIEIGVYLANKNIRVEVIAGKPENTEKLGRYIEELKGSLSEFGWVVDEILYKTAERDISGNVVRSVVEHHITQDSLSRLF